MDTDNKFDSLDLQKIFESLPDNKKLEFLQDLHRVVNASDAYLADVEGVIADAIEEFGGKKTNP